MMTLGNDIEDLINQQLLNIKQYVSENKISAFRLINNTRTFLPLTVDIYQDNAVIHIFSRVESELLKELEQQVKNIIPVTTFFYKKNQRMFLPCLKAVLKK